MASIAIGKGAISKYISGGCQRRLKLDLFANDRARAAEGAVGKDTRRPGAEYLKEQGRSHERACFQDLISAFKDKVRRGANKPFEEGEEVAFESLLLADSLPQMRPGDFLVEAAYAVPPSFAKLHGLDRIGDGNNRLGENRPDLIFAVPPGLEIKGLSAAAERREIRADGSLSAVTDARLGLLVVDIKMSAEPNPSQFAELAYYGMSLASWLDEAGLASRFYVVADAMIWSGRHGGSSLRSYINRVAGSYQVPSTQDYLSAWFEDLEPMPAEVMLARLLRVLHVDLPQVASVANWRDLPVHVSTRCSGCDYLGFPWSEGENKKDERYCWPTAARTSSLCRIPGMSEGAAGKLGEHGISTVEAFAALTADDPLFEEHQGLRSGRHALLSRAKALVENKVVGLPSEATSAAIPSFSDLRIAISVDFDAASKQAFALGYEIVAAVPTGRQEVPEWKGSVARTAVFRGEVKLVSRPGVDAERRAFSQFLEAVQNEILSLKAEVAAGYSAVGKSDRKPTMQVYIWNRAAFEQFRTMMTRHMTHLPQVDARTGISPFAWLFPPDTLLQDAETMGRRAPITIVSQAVNLLAINIPHHYPQMAVANAYRYVRPGANREPYEYKLGHAFFDPLSDQIPSERGHELWAGKAARADETFDDYCTRLKRAVRLRLQATLSIARTLAHDLNERLVARAPAVDDVFAPVKPLFRVANDLQVIYQHARLMKAAAEVDIDLTMAMSPAEREANYRSIRLDGAFHGDDRRRILEAAGLLDRSGDRNVFAFSMSPLSRDANFKAGDFNISLMPEAKLFQHTWVLAKLRKEHPGLDQLVPVEEGRENEQFRLTVRQACGAAILAIDPRNLTIVVAVTKLTLAMVDLQLFDFGFTAEQMGIIDPVHTDFFVGPRLRPILETIGTPPLSIERRLVSSNISRVSLRAEAPGAATPLDRFVWDAKSLSKTASGRRMELAEPGVMAVGRPPLPAQMEAIRKAIELRLSLLWGPPGTGKSATAIRLLIGLLAEAEARGEVIRIAITGPTWVAIENVAQELPEVLARVPYGSATSLVRLVSPTVSIDTVAPRLRKYAVTTDKADERLPSLSEALLDRRRSVIVAGTSTQLAKLAKIVRPEGGGLQQPLFDFMLIDEASQMDVANAIVAFSTLAENASVAVVGDDKQMPPVHAIDPPVGHEHVVGSIYDFYANYQVDGRHAPVEPTMLDTNFRSNVEIVDFFAHAGYRNLSAANSRQRMTLATPLGADPPANWPKTLDWSPSYASVLDGDRPLVSIIHQDRYSSQRNVDEARSVVAMIAALRGRLMPIGGSSAFDDEKLFEEGVGVVTPHRAQRAAVIDAIAKALDLSGPAFQKMAASVDTVERFQGQQRVAMFCSFGMADLDAIAGEEEFLFNLNRFNVIVSRAMAKLVVLMSRRMADHLPSDIEVLRSSHLLKRFVSGSWASRVEDHRLPYLGPVVISSL